MSTPRRRPLRSGLASQGRYPHVLFDEGDPEAVYPAQPLISRLGAVLAQRCPVCLMGPMFRGPRTMNEKCTACGHHLLRDTIFRRGAMAYAIRVVSTIAIAAGFLGLVLLMQRFLPSAGLAIALPTAFTFEMLLVPTVYRYTRVIWAHLTLLTDNRGGTPYGI